MKTLQEVTAAAILLSIADRRALKVSINTSIKADADVTKLETELSKEAGEAKRTAEGEAYLKKMPLGQVITATTATGVMTLEIVNINFDKKTVSGFKLIDGKKTLNDSGKTATGWRFFHQVIVGVPVTYESIEADKVAEEIADEE